VTLASAYTICRGIARREAKNFYWSFRVLPLAKRDAMCAVYAFMRKADDLSDDESIPIARRRTLMADWLNAWRAARDGAPTDDPIFLALNDTQRRFTIPNQLLEELVQGTTMDLAEEQPGVIEVTLTTTTATTTQLDQYQIYHDFGALSRYCYLVASVVGLVCIRIFGYTDPDAERLAADTGIAFQLTNILRDVREDAERGRIYLPLADLEQHGCTLEEIVLAAKAAAATPPNTRAVLRFEADRAQHLYRSARQLLPLIDPDSRAALWVMVAIYRQLLVRIQKMNYQVFASRASVSTPMKLYLLVHGGIMAAALRRKSSKASDVS
jgi:phytoene synthase